MAYLKNISVTNDQGRFFKVIQGRYSEAGISDIIGVYKGCFCAIEVKSSKGVASRKQIIFQRQIKAAGGYAIIVKSVNEVKNLILEIDDAFKA